MPERWSAGGPSLSGRDDPLDFLQRLAGGRDVAPFRLGRRQAFLLVHPSCVDDVLVRNAHRFEKGPGYDRARRLLGDGLLTASEAAHAAQRRRVQPAFHRQALARYAARTAALAGEVCDRLADGQPIDMAAEMQALALRIAGETLFGAALAHHARAIRQAIDGALPAVNGLVAVVAPSSRVRAARRRLDAFVDGLVDERLRTDQAGDDALGLLIEAERPTGDGRIRIRDQALTLLLAAHDTIAHALTWAWIAIGLAPDLQDRLSHEARRVAGARPMTGDDLPRLDLARRVLAETLRLHPPAWAIVRRARERHAVAGTTIPAGALVVASPFVTQRDARFYASPLDFDPDRWLGAPPPRLAYFPFGAGPRACIGEGFAWMEGTLVLAVLSQQWRFELRPGRPPANPKITLRPQGPVPMVARRV